MRWPCTIDFQVYVWYSCRPRRGVVGAQNSVSHCPALHNTYDTSGILDILEKKLPRTCCLLLYPALPWMLALTWALQSTQCSTDQGVGYKRLVCRGYPLSRHTHKVCWAWQVFVVGSAGWRMQDLRSVLWQPVTSGTNAKDHIYSVRT